DVLLATALAVLLVFWQFVHNFHTWQLSRKRLALTASWLGFGLLSSNRGCCFRQDRLMLSIDLLLFIRSRRHGLFSLVKHPHLRIFFVSGLLLGTLAKQTHAHQGQLFFEPQNLGLTLHKH